MNYVSAPLVPELCKHFKTVWSEADLHVSYNPAHLRKQKLKCYYNSYVCM